MAITKEQMESAINRILMDEVQSALSRRRASPIHVARSQLFEEVGSYEVVEARKRVEEAAHLLGEAKSLLEADPQLHEMAGQAFEAAYGLMGELDNHLEGDEPEDPSYPGGTSGVDDALDGEDVDLPPMHPRGRR